MGWLDLANPQTEAQRHERQRLDLLMKELDSQAEPLSEDTHRIAPELYLRAAVRNIKSALEIMPASPEWEPYVNEIEALAEALSYRV